MLREERYREILDLVNERGSISTSDLEEKLKASPSTVRRDLTELERQGKLKKVFGGAKKITKPSFIGFDEDMTVKEGKNMRQKLAIGKLAAGLIEENDFIYMDAGTSVEAMITFIGKENLTFVTNSVGIGRELASLKYKVIILPGFLKLTTDSIIGSPALEYLDSFSFSKGFFGTNGIDSDFFFTTPDINEALVKKKAISKCQKAYILADQSKFNKISQVTFSKDTDLPIITEEKNEEGRVGKITYLKEEK